MEAVAQAFDQSAVDFTGSAADEVLPGQQGSDRFEGGGGRDTLIGREGNDLLLGRDSVADARISCGEGGGDDDRAVVDAVDPVDPDCETIERGAARDARADRRRRPGGPARGLPTAAAPGAGAGRPAVQRRRGRGPGGGDNGQTPPELEIPTPVAFVTPRPDPDPRPLRVQGEELCRAAHADRRADTPRRAACACAAGRAWLAAA